MLRAKGDFLATDFSEMLTDMFGAPPRDPSDTVVEFALASWGWVTNPPICSDSRTTYGTWHPHSEGDELFFINVVANKLLF